MTTDDQGPAPGMTCSELTELVTAYLEGALPERKRAEAEEHLTGCEGCQRALAQWRAVIDLAGELTDADVEGVDPLERERLMSTFQRLRRR